MPFYKAMTSESLQGYAVPTPRVPVLPTSISGPKINGAVNGDHFTYDFAEEEILVPPPPSMAPPPPPETFILPPPDFMGYLSSLEVAALQPPPTHAPKPPETNRRIIKPPPKAPPKPPSTGSSSSASSTPISKPSPAKVPKHPNYAPPPPPAKGQPKPTKTPPPKPIRLSSMNNLDSPPQFPAPLPPAQTPTQSTFNPQNAAKLNHVSNTSILRSYEEQDARPKQMLLLEDTASARPVPMLVPVNGNVPRETPTKPIRKDPQHHKENLQSTDLTHKSRHEPPQSIPDDVRYHKENIQSIPPMREVTPKANTVTVSAQNEAVKPLRVSYQIPRKLQTVNKTRLTSQNIQGKLGPQPAGNFSPISDETPAASPLSLLMAAKERDRFKGFQSQEIGTIRSNQRRGSFHNNPIPKTVPTMSRAISSSSLLHQDKVQVSPTSVSPTQYWETKSATIAQINNEPIYSNWTQPTSSSHMSNRLVERKESYVKSGGGKEHVVMPLLPPPPEFEDFGGIMDSPPSMRPPDPPLKYASLPNINSLPPAHIPPTPSKHPSHNVGVQPKSQFQTNSKVNPAQQQQPTAQSPSQTTLVSILQKKMLEMDHKITTTDEADYDADDWAVPLSEDIKVIPKSTPQAKSVSTGTKQTATHHKQEFNGKVARKIPEINSNEVQSSHHQFGMTYRIRPGTKQPITLIRKGLS
ncbi:uncharacterized protein LOC144023864 isoform X2 [Festucalex cinctus]